MIPRRELAASGAVQNQGEQYKATQHVRAMEAGHREERAGKGAGGEVQAPIESTDELNQLPDLEHDAQDDGRDLQHEELPPPVMRQSFEREMACHTAREQPDRVEERNPPPADVVLRRAAGRDGRPRRMRSEDRKS